MNENKMSEAFVAGFMSKCAEAGIEKEAAIGLLRGLAAKAFPSVGRSITRNAARIAAGRGGPKAISQIIKRRGATIAGAMKQQNKNFRRFSDFLDGQHNYIRNEGYYGPGPGEPWSSYGDDIVRLNSRHHYNSVVPENRRPGWLASIEKRNPTKTWDWDAGKDTFVGTASKDRYLEALREYMGQPHTIGDVAYGVPKPLGPGFYVPPISQLPKDMENVARTAYDRVGGLNRLLERNTRPIDLQDLVAQLSRG